MKKFFTRFFSLLIVAASLVFTSCGNAGNLDGSSSSSKKTETSSTKYSPATVPSQTTAQQTTEESTSSDTEEITSTEESTSTEETASTEETTAESTESPKPSVGVTDEEISELVTQKYLTVRERSRSGNKLTELKEIVIHYVANPKTSALQNWNYFETQSTTYVSAHFIIDMDGSIIQCMPLDEVAWAIGTTEGNYSTISIECCHPDKTGKFTDATYDSLIKLVSWLCNEFGLTADNVKRHYDYPRTNSSGVVWHKSCPLYFVDHPEKWEEFKNSLLIE